LLQRYYIYAAGTGNGMKLTDNQKEIIYMLLEGKSHKQIAKETNRSVHTISNTIAVLREKADTIGRGSPTVNLILHLIRIGEIDINRHRR